MAPDASSWTDANFTHGATSFFGGVLLIKGPSVPFSDVQAIHHDRGLESGSRPRIGPQRPRKRPFLHPHRVRASSLEVCSQISNERPPPRNRLFPGSRSRLPDGRRRRKQRPCRLMGNLDVPISAQAHRATGRAQRIHGITSESTKTVSGGAQDESCPMPPVRPVA